MINEYNLARFCCGDPNEIVNYENAIADTTQTWECHHRKGLKYSKEELIEKGWYYKRAPEELIFLTQFEHRSLHHKGKPKKPRTAEHCVNLSKSLKQKYKDDPEYSRMNSERQKGKKLTAETREKMCIAKIGRKLTAEHCAALSKAKKGKPLTTEHRENCGKVNKGKTWKLINGKRVWLSKEVVK